MIINIKQIQSNSQQEIKSTTEQFVKASSRMTFTSTERFTRLYESHLLNADLAFQRKEKNQRRRSNKMATIKGEVQKGMQDF